MTNLSDGDTIQHDGREYVVTVHNVDHLPRLKADMIKRGWVPESYLLTGKRGATYHAYRSARTGEVVMMGRV